MNEKQTFRAVFWAGVGLLAVAGGGLALWVMRDLLAPVLAGLLVAYLLYPGTVRLARLGIARWLSVTVLILVVLVLGGLALYWTVPVMNREFKVISNPATATALQSSLLLTRLSAFSDQLAAYGFIPQPWPVELVRTRIAAWVSSEGAWLVGTVSGFVWSSLEFLLMFVFALVFGLIDGRRFYRGFLGLLPNAFFEAGVLIVNESAKIFGGYLRGVVVETIVLAALMLALLLPCCLFTKLPVALAVIIALLIALTNPIRYLGPIIGTALGMVLVLIFTTDLLAVGAVLLASFAAQVIDDLVVLPLAMRSEVDIHPLTSLLAVAAGGVIAGALGMILAIPVVGGVKAAYRTITVEMKRFQTLTPGRAGPNDRATGRPAGAPGGA